MILGIISIVAGIFIIKFRKVVIKENFSWQKENVGLKFGKQQFMVDEMICIVVGSVLVIGGLLISTGVINIR